MVSQKHQTHSVRIAIAADGNETLLCEYAKALSSKLELPLIDVHQRALDEFDLLLVATGARLELREIGKKPAGPVYVDFMAGPVAYRRISGISRRQPIARAVGLRGGPVHVVDATAGLGRDAFLLACLGCTVTAIERSAILMTLLNDGIQRARKSSVQNSDLIQVLERITLLEGDACVVLKRLSILNPEVVYLDPMYPARGKSSVVKKEMRICRKLVGDDPDMNELISVAMETAVRRVVVKRHPHTPPLSPKPSLCFTGRTVRYDVYLRHNRNSKPSACIHRG